MRSPRLFTAEPLRQQVQLFIRRFGLLSEDNTPCGLPISPREAHALMILFRHERRDELLSQNDLVLELGIDKSNVTRLLQGLQKRGSIARVPGKEDARVRMHRLTPRGREFAQRIEDSSRHRFSTLFAGLSPSDMKMAAAALALLNRALEKSSMEVKLNAHA
jgi:DNA-binding MarR family transcriptional regulator